jgi:hypothetical protein
MTSFYGKEIDEDLETVIKKDFALNYPSCKKVLAPYRKPLKA